MKNTTNVDKIYYCYNCNLKGFFCYTPEGADFETCPCCGSKDYLNYIVNIMNRGGLSSRYDFLFDDDDNSDDMRIKYKYCDDCKIIFCLGCTHRLSGCTDSTFNCHFIKKWKNKNTGIIYDGMPRFDDTDDWFNNVNNVEILELYCPHNGVKCSNEGYNFTTNCNLNPL